MAEFIHLHLKSEYSLLDGACRIRDVVKAAKAAGMRAVALTDAGVMFGAVSFYCACRDEGIQPIIGCEVQVARPGDTGGALVLLVMNECGYVNLCRLVTGNPAEHTDGKRTIEWKSLAQYNEGLIALSGGERGEVTKRLAAGDKRGAAELISEMKAIFGDRYYLEITDRRTPEDRRTRAMLLSLGEQQGVACVATNDVCFLNREDYLTRQVLICIGEGCTLDSRAEASRSFAENYFKNGEEMEAIFASTPELLSNTLAIAARCDFSFSFGKTKLPRFDPPMGKDPKAYLSELTVMGLKRRVEAGDIVYDEKNDEEAYRMRIAYEQVVIGSMGYAPYFLIVADFVGWAKAHEIPTGPGRGSGAGSLVAYLIGITEVDPVKYGLLFESFLNPERISMPDFDIDFCDRRRDEVIAYVTEKYGADHVCQIVTFGTMAARAAVRDVGRVLGMTTSEVDTVAKLIPRELKMTLEEALKVPALRKLYEESVEVKRLIDVAKSVEGMPRHASTHAAGVVITDKPLVEYLPLTKSGDVTLTQYDMDTVAKLGLLKFDFLALRYLTVIDDTAKLVKKHVRDFSLDAIPLDDEQTYQLISSGKTDGLFQLESAGMRQLLTAFKPSCITDIMTAIALYRPGPMDSIDRYLQNRNKAESPAYPIAELAPILDETCGCIVYQEQVMQIFRAIAGYSYGKADVVRRAISKKKPEVLEREREKFIEGATEKGAAYEVAQALFEDMTDFAGYGFKKSHAAAYAVLSYQTAYLKAHYPAYYYASLLSSVLGNLAKMSEYITECTKMGIEILRPDVNKSGMTFLPEGKGIRFGLLAIKNVGVNFIARLIREREHRPFDSLYDFLNRLSGGDANKRAVEAMIRAGAFDTPEINRSQLLAGFEILMDRFSAKGSMEGQMDLFGSEPTGFRYPELPDFTIKDKLRMEKDVCGMCVSGHLLDDYRLHVEALASLEIADVLSRCAEGGGRDGEEVVLCGILAGRNDKITKNGETMTFLALEDRIGTIEIVVFPKAFASLEPLMQMDNAVALSGRLSLREEEAPKVLLDRMVPLIANERFHASTYRSPFEKNTVSLSPPMKQYAPPPPRVTVTQESSTMKSSVGDGKSTPNGARVTANAPDLRAGATVYLKVPSMSGRIFEKAVTLCEIFEGASEVVFFLAEEKKYVRAAHLSLDPTPFVLAELEALLGKGNVALKAKGGQQS